MKRKYYSTREQIIKEIESNRQKQAEDRVEAKRLDDLANKSFSRLSELDWDELSDTQRRKYEEEKFMAQELRKQADFIRKRQPGIESKLQHLKRTLAAFDTRPMPFVGEGVVMQ